MSSTAFAQNMAAVAGASRLRTLGCCTAWAIGFAGVNPSTHAYADAMKRSTRHLGGLPT